MITATYYIVASTGTYTGTGMSKSPKRAYAAAVEAAWNALCAGDAKANYCSGIAVEGWRMWRGTQLLGREDNF